MTMTYGEKMALKAPVSREEAERVLAKDGIGCGAVMALRFARTLLATMSELEQVKGERDALKVPINRLVVVLDRNERKGPIPDIEMMFCWMAAQDVRAALAKITGVNA